jgi:hypothetical protein
MDEFENYIQDNSVTEENILKYIDDYSIYCHYLGFEPELSCKISSPLHNDKDPSFVLYESDRYETLMFFDYSLGLSGSVFKFVSQLFGISRRDAAYKINSDLEIGLGTGKESFDPGTLTKYKPKPKPKTVIRITSEQRYSQRFLEYWAQFGIVEQFLLYYNVREVCVLHLMQGPKRITIYPKGLCIAYPIYNEYKIYEPNNPKFKFKNNYLREYVEGALQLTFEHDFVLITKSTKECIFFRNHFGWDAVASHSETVPIMQYFMIWLFAKFKYVFIWLDNDGPGVKSQAQYLAKYPKLIPIDCTHEQKDPTDMYKFAKDKQQILLQIYTTVMEKL